MYHVWQAAWGLVATGMTENSTRELLSLFFCPPTSISMAAIVPQLDHSTLPLHSEIVDFLAIEDCKVHWAGLDP